MTMCKATISVFLVLNIFIQIKTARILAIFPTPLISHHVDFRSFTQELAKHGHQVYVVTAEPEFAEGGAPANLTEIDIHDAMHDTWKSVLIEMRKKNIFNVDKIMYSLQRSLFQKLINMNEFKILLEGKFDLLFIEAYFRSLLAFTEQLRIPSILISSFGGSIGVYETVGVPVHPMIYPSYTRQKIFTNTIFEELSEVFNDASIRYLHGISEEMEDDLLKSINLPPLKKLRYNVDLLFVNYYPVLDSNVPVPPGVIYFGGARDIKAKELPTDLKSYMDSSTAGVIYVSFSTSSRSRFFKPLVLPMLMRIFSRLPYNVLMRWPEEVAGRSQNVRIEKWIPQVDILGHPNTKLYITQAGLQSSLEAITFGVPVIGAPMWFDQFVNAENYVKLGLGARIDINTVTETELEKIILELISDGSYRRNMANFRSLLSDQRIPPLQRVIWWTEHVLKQGSRHLRAPAANITWSEYFEVELLIILSTLFTVFWIIVLILVRMLFRFVSRSRNAVMYSREIIKMSVD